MRAGVVRAAADDERKRETENRAVSAYEKARSDAVRTAREQGGAIIGRINLNQPSVKP